MLGVRHTTRCGLSGMVMVRPSSSCTWREAHAQEQRPRMTALIVAMVLLRIWYFSFNRQRNTGHHQQHMVGFLRHLLVDSSQEITKKPAARMRRMNTAADFI